MSGAEGGRWRVAGRAVAFVLAAAYSAAMLRDTLAQPFSTDSPFRAWIPDAWRSAYPWGVVVAAAAAVVASRRGRPFGPGDALGAGLVGALAARFLAPALYAGAGMLLRGESGDSALLAITWVGLTLENWLPLFVAAWIALEALGAVARRARGGWPQRRVRPRRTSAACRPLPWGRRRARRP